MYRQVAFQIIIWDLVQRYPPEAEKWQFSVRFVHFLSMNHYKGGRYMLKGKLREQDIEEK